MNKIKLLFITLLFVFIPTVMAEEITTSKPSLITSTTNATKRSTTTTSRRTYSSYDYEDELDEEDDELESSSSSTYYKMSSNSIVRKNESSGYTYFIDDGANLIKNDDQKEELLKTLELCSEFGNAGFVSLSVNTSNPTSYAQNWYHNHFSTQSGTIFMINMKIRKITVFSDGKNYSKVTTNKAESIVSNVYRYASKEDYFSCTNKAFKQIYTLLSGKQIFEPMKMVSNLFISITFATIICYIYVLSSSQIKKAKGKELFGGIEKDVLISDINIVKTGTRRVYSPQSSGGSSGGGGGGGGSSGGGASHGF